MLWIRERFLPHFGGFERVIVHGHTIFEEIENRPGRIGIDTGAFRFGRLTALVLEGEMRRYIQKRGGRSGYQSNECGIAKPKAKGVTDYLRCHCDNDEARPSPSDLLSELKVASFEGRIAATVGNPQLAKLLVRVEIEILCLLLRSRIPVDNDNRSLSFNRT